MPELLYPYLVGFATVVLVSIIAMAYYLATHARAVDLERRERRIPAAARFEDLEERVADLQDQRDQLTQKLVEAKATIEDALSKQQWLQQHGEDITRMRVEKEQLERHHQEFERVTGALADASQNLQDLGQRLKDAQFEVEQSAKRLKDSELRHGELVPRLKAIVDDLQDRQEELRKAELDLQKLRLEGLAEKASVAALIKQSEGLEAKVSSLRAELKDLEKKADTARKALSAAEADVAGQQQMLDGLRGSIEASLKERRHLDPTTATRRKR